MNLEWTGPVTHLHLAGQTEGHCQRLKFLVGKGIHSEGARLMAGRLVIHPGVHNFTTRKDTRN